MVCRKSFHKQGKGGYNNFNAVTIKLGIEKLIHIGVYIFKCFQIRRMGRHCNSSKWSVMSLHFGIVKGIER